LYYRNAETAQVDNPNQPVSQQQTQQDIPVGVTQQDPGQQNSADSQTQTQPDKKSMKTAAPVDGEFVAEYAMDCLSYNQTTRDWRVHNGVDIAAEAGTQVCAAADGTVYTVYEDETMGMTVVIRHEGGYVTKYASLAQEVSVAPGDTVQMGQAIGCVGQTALLESAIGDHVHFSVTCNDAPVDPADFLALA
jgi:murein DD-endopeptidase MepM/ murein hydrolase activator NlpD